MPRPRRDRPRSPPDWSARRACVPSAITAPAFMQTVRGHNSTITGMSWLTSRNVCPAAWLAADEACHDLLHGRMHRRERLVEQRDLRRHHEARRRIPGASSGRPKDVRRPGSSGGAAIDRRAAPAPDRSAASCGRPSAQPATIRLSSTLMRGNTRVSWNVRSTPSCASASGRRPSMSRAVEQTSPVIRCEMTAQDVDEGGLARSVRTDQADEIAGSRSRRSRRRAP